MLSDRSCTKAFSAFTTSALAKCWPARCCARSHSRPRATRTVSELRTHTRHGRAPERKSCLEPGLGIRVLGRFHRLSAERSAALGVSAARVTLRPDSAQQRPHQMALWIALSPQWARAVKRVCPRLPPISKAGVFLDGQSSAEV